MNNGLNKYNGFNYWLIKNKGLINLSNDVIFSRNNLGEKYGLFKM